MVDDGRRSPSRTATFFVTIVVVLLSLSLLSPPSFFVASIGFDGIPGDYCKIRYPVQCCPSRNDDCSVRILGNHLCYCDMFCDRRPNSDDCCPDFKYVCAGEPIPEPTPHPSLRDCVDELGNLYPPGSHKINCNTCTCPSVGGALRCDDAACLIQPDLLSTLNQDGRYTWRGTNYSDFWGQTLDEGVRYRLGTLFPSRTVQNMNDILIEPSADLPEQFDARQKWPNFIHPVRNQGNCGSSWAFSTTDVSADRLAIQSEGKFNLVLSPQQVISCNQHRQDGCSGGHLDRAWWYLRKLGVTSEQCYPYTSGSSNDPGSCLIDEQAYRKGQVTCPSGSLEIVIHKMTPPYKISSKEEEIKDEIYRNGPVQATIQVHEDFYMYKSGVYQHLALAIHKPEQYRKSGYHSVRIIGWGVDHSSGRSVKYWLCANSWGVGWGEEGLFRIVRGENHCEIEAFVLGAWGKGSKRRRRRFRLRKAKRLRK